MKLRINPLVVSDLKDIRNYIAEDNTEKSTETIDKSMQCEMIMYKVGKEYVEIYRVVNRYQDITRIFD